MNFVGAILLLGISISSVLAVTECPPHVSSPIKATLDGRQLFSACATGVKEGQVNVLFDVLNLSDRDFLAFCRSSRCIKPVALLLQSIPNITYQGSARNISQEVSTLYHHCANVVGTADKTDEDYVYRYFLD
ncbi:Elicitin [Phytophthora infestans]|uniref:Elicitin n=1 Tax=Phytophthora infestans TaxID=4787 RepID=A0A8S9UL41_PHYIN|nr:Elicitin [Phytophthora infestans]KAF4141605.1 Elicitin [Phytophthora infestans]